VLIGPGNGGPPPTRVGLPNFGTWVRDVNDGSRDGGSELLEDKLAHGESLMARLASLTIL